MGQSNREVLGRQGRTVAIVICWRQGTFTLANFVQDVAFTAVFTATSVTPRSLRHLFLPQDSMTADLKWLGLQWDEGPGTAKEEEMPFRQSERGSIYHEMAEKLMQQVGSDGKPVLFSATGVVWHACWHE